MSTVLGLALTPALAEVILVAGRDASGAVVSRSTFEIPAGGGATVVDASARVVESVLQAHSGAAATGRDIYAIGVTWADDVAPAAALVLEKLTDAGLGNVVQVRFHQAVETAQSLGLDAPAHGAAVVSTRAAAFPAVAVAEAPPPAAGADRPTPQALQYAGALTTVIVGALTFVVSLSLAVSLQHTPDRELGPIEQVANTTERTVERSATPPAPAAPDLPDVPADIPAAPAESGEPELLLGDALDEAVLPDDPAELPDDPAGLPDE